jgi:hypothetical protein
LIRWPNQPAVDVNARLSVEPRFDFDLRIDDFELDYLRFVNTTTEKASLEFIGRLNGYAAAERTLREKRLAEVPFSPYVVLVGIVPVVIRPIVSVNAGGEIEFSADFRTGISQTATVTAGAEYEYGTFTPIYQVSNEFAPTPPTVSGNAYTRGYVGPELMLEVNGIGGPYAALGGYLELSADSARTDTPWWTLYGGVDATAGVRVEVFDHVLANWEESRDIARRLLLSATTPPPVPTGSDVKLQLYWYPVSQGNAPSGGGTKILNVPSGFRKVTLTSVTFDDVGYIEVNGTRVFEISPCRGAATYTPNLDVTRYVHAGSNTIYGYANNCVVLTAEATAIFRIE